MRTTRSAPVETTHKPLACTPNPLFQTGMFPSVRPQVARTRAENSRMSWQIAGRESDDFRLPRRSYAILSTTPTSTSNFSTTARIRTLLQRAARWQRGPRVPPQSKRRKSCSRPRRTRSSEQAGLPQCGLKWRELAQKTPECRGKQHRRNPRSSPRARTQTGRRQHFELESFDRGPKGGTGLTARRPTRRCGSRRSSGTDSARSGRGRLP